MALIAETAAWVAAFRAHESARPDRLFDDPFAQYFKPKMPVPANRLAEGIIVQRTVAFDEMILSLCRAGTVDTVINLACGYDARPYRMPLPGELRWVEIDLPPVIARKADTLAAFKPHCRVERIALDLSIAASRELIFRQLVTPATRALVVTEGLLMYLSERDASDLAESLHAQAAFKFWLADIMSPRARDRMNAAARRQLDHAGTRLNFAPAHGADCFRAYGWEPDVCRPSIAEMNRLGRGPGPILNLILRAAAHFGRPAVDANVLLSRREAP